ncbi:MAG TPA: PhzF family phenazine biosynthesis protein [Sphingomicrobium sp.]|nr:PhzF family phenazine biosynthesis protein [Sphingomicrobium sp.]
MRLEYRQVDVFASAPLSGNGLAVVITEAPLDTAFMQRLTCELRQFETIFLVPAARPATYEARVFTMEEELPFAGHPSIGAAAVLHERAGGDRYDCRLVLGSGTVELSSQRSGAGFRVTMEQGTPEFGDTLAPDSERDWLAAFGLDGGDRDRRMPLCVASTGLPYLVVPVTSAGLGKARVRVDDLEKRVAGIGAKFVYVLDIEEREGRTWDNQGIVEDIATGSAAGPAAALLVKHGLAEAEKPILIRQGRFVGRPSEMRLEVAGSREQITGVALSGSVAMVATGQFDAAVAFGGDGARRGS